MKGVVNSKGKWSGWVDWGNCCDRPYLSWNSFMESNWKNGNKFTAGTGLVVTKPNWSYLAQMVKDEHQVTLFKDNFWWKSGNFLWAHNSSVNLKTFEKAGKLAMKYNATPEVTCCLGYEVNDSNAE